MSHKVVAAALMLARLPVAAQIRPFAANFRAQEIATSGTPPLDGAK